MDNKHLSDSVMLFFGFFLVPLFTSFYANEGYKGLMLWVAFGGLVMSLWHLFFLGNDSE